MTGRGSHTTSERLGLRQDLRRHRQRLAIVYLRQSTVQEVEPPKRSGCAFVFPLQIIERSDQLSYFIYPAKQAR